MVCTAACTVRNSSSHLEPALPSTNLVPEELCGCNFGLGAVHIDREIGYRVRLNMRKCHSHRSSDDLNIGILCKRLLDVFEAFRIVKRKPGRGVLHFIRNSGVCVEKIELLVQGRKLTRSITARAIPPRFTPHSTKSPGIDFASCA